MWLGGERRGGGWVPLVPHGEFGSGRKKKKKREERTHEEDTRIVTFVVTFVVTFGVTYTRVSSARLVGLVWDRGRGVGSGESGGAVDTAMEGHVAV